MLFKVHVLSVFIVQIACILSVLLIFGLQSTDIRVLDSVLFLCYLMLMFFFALLMLIFSRHSLHWSIESQARTWRRPKRYPGFHILHNIDIVSCTCCMYIPVYFVLCTIYIYMLSENKEDLPLHFTHLHTSQSNHFYQHLHFWLPICNKSFYERRVQICLQKPLPGCQDDKINLFQEPFLIREGPKWKIPCIQDMYPPRLDEPPLSFPRHVLVSW